MQFTKFLLVLPIALLFLSCDNNKPSPDRSTQKEEQEEKEGQRTKKEKAEKPYLVSNVSCPFYPSHSQQPDWQEYIKQIQPEMIEKSNWQMNSSLESFYSSNGDVQDVLFKKFSITTSQPVKKYNLIKVYKKIKINDCNYPSVRVYKDQEDKKIYRISEWDSKEFYQPEHIVIDDKNLLIHLMQSGQKFFPHPLYKEKISFAKKPLFLRPLFGSFKLNLESYSRMHSIDDARLIITGRFGTIVGNLSFYVDGEKYEFYMGSLDVYIWQKNRNEAIYQIEWTMNGPEFKNDDNNVKTEAARGNFDSSQNRIRMYYINPNPDKEMEFVLEFHDLLEGADSVFSSTYSPHF